MFRLELCAQEGQVRHWDTEPLQVCARHVQVYFVAFFADMADLVDHLGAAWANLVPYLRYERWIGRCGLFTGFGHDSASVAPKLRCNHRRNQRV
jgi:hypothetical protein